MDLGAEVSQMCHLYLQLLQRLLALPLRLPPAALLALQHLDLLEHREGEPRVRATPLPARTAPSSQLPAKASSLAPRNTEPQAAPHFHTSLPKLRLLYLGESPGTALPQHFCSRPGEGAETSSEDQEPQNTSLPPFLNPCSVAPSLHEASSQPRDV